MMRRIIHLALAGLLLSSAFSAEKIAVATKKQGAVNLKQGETQKQSELKRGSILHDQDVVTTGRDGSALILFLDDKSQLKLKGNTEVLISGSREQAGISKRISMEQGVLKASISPQRQGEFVIATPTSVASVKGTEFWIISIPDSGDIVVSNSGVVELVNSVTGEVITVPAGVIIESTADGEMNVLETIKISGTATGQPSGDQFSLQNIQLLEGDVELSAVSGTVTVTDNTVYEGGAIDAGIRVTARGAFDSQSGALIATLCEVASPLQIEGTVTEITSTDIFAVGDVSITAGEAESMPGYVAVTPNTATAGDDLAVGATIEALGYFNTDTGVLSANSITVAAPATVEIVTISGIAQSAVVNNQFEVSQLSVVDGDIEAANFSGIILTSSNTEFTGAVVDSGMNVVVSGAYNDSSQTVSALSVTATRGASADQIAITVSGVAQTGLVNSQFIIGDIEIIEGDVQPDNLSGTITVTDSTVTDECAVEIGSEILVVGVYNPGDQSITAAILDACGAEEEPVTVIISGTVMTGLSMNQFTLSDFTQLDGDADVLELNGIVVPEDFTTDDCDVLPGATVVVNGIYANQVILASSVVVELMRVGGVVVAEPTNNLFEMNDLVVLAGSLEESGLSGQVKITGETEYEPGDLQPGNTVIVESCRLEPGTGYLLARRITLEEAIVRELIFELENAQGDKKDLIITF